MEQIGERLILHYVPGTGIALPLGGVNILTIFSTLVVMVALWVVLWLGIRRRALVPGRGQMLVELFVGAFDGLVASSLEFETTEQNRKFLPLIASLFLFLLLSNFMGFVPSAYIEEPTADINCTLGLGCMAMTIATYCGIRTKGLVGYISELFGPLWSEETSTGAARVAGKLSALFFFPLNVIGELAKIISISFRLFGNILGGGIIIVVVSTLVYHMVLPIGMNLFFVFFVGTVQAFVFTMLTLTYVAVAVK
jgi:F-type H+-transporting ATPase subunit a